GWVTTLVRSLKQRLARKLGRNDSFELWHDAKLPGHVDVNQEILGRVHDAAVLLLVLSTGYLKSVWCLKEMAAFHEEIRRRKASGGRVFVVEFDWVNASEKPPELTNLKGYTFWVKHRDTGKPRTLGYPIVRENDDDYHEQLNDLCIELVRELEELKKCE